LDFIKIEGFHQDGLLLAPGLLAQFSEGSGDEGRPIKREAATVPSSVPMRLEATRLNGRVVCQWISPLEILRFLVFAKVRSLKQTPE
tara:strand:- start:202 stop:462 length:261 start_codon:yes stop_codon:yes gene_type:complete